MMLLRSCCHICRTNNEIRTASLQLTVADRAIIPASPICLCVADLTLGPGNMGGQLRGHYAADRNVDHADTFLCC